MFRRALLIVLLSGLLGILVNSVSPRGISISGPVPMPEIEGVKQIGLVEAWRFYQSGEVIFVDARSREEYEAGSIPGAVSLGVDEFEEKVSSFLELIPRDTMLVVFCTGRGCESSLEVAALLRQAGFPHIYLFFEGWEEWTKSGYPTSNHASDSGGDALL